ncbi:dTDP-4-dehydrorhamnose reductase [Microbispora sp. NPDC088329]|uniref:dTDP-4-dehydrorhamnose reductase n=1 Tax=Microbispora sp. NPDC088329 TaxID=3154869 RepID=UPI0034217899
MRWLVTGAGGLLGTDLVALLREEGETVVAPTRSELDVRDAGAVAAAVRDAAPDVVVNCAGWTAVDDAETREEEALAVNGHAVGDLAAACRERLVQLSTDYVFDGRAAEPYPEDAEPAPVSAYGRTKLAGERAALAHGGTVVRTAWLYGVGGPNFVRTMTRLAAGDGAVRVVADQVGQPTWTADLAAQLFRLVTAGAPPGVYHATSSGSTSWYGLAREVFELAGADPDRVTPVTTAEFPRPAPRPASSVLGHGGWTAAGISPIRDWRAALRAAWPYLSEA